MKIISYNDSLHRHRVIELWKSVFQYRDPRNNPALVIDKKISARDGLFFVAVEDDAVVGTVMAGYDGHRGWIYTLAVEPHRRKRGIGSGLLRLAEKKLINLGCMKINLQILDANKDVAGFYRKNGYEIEERISMGKEIKENI